MWSWEWSRNLGDPEFFRLSLFHDSLANHFQTNFALMQHHKYSLSDLESMLPWEREIYVALLANHVEEENKKAKARAAR